MLFYRELGYVIYLAQRPTMRHCMGATATVQSPSGRVYLSDKCLWIGLCHLSRTEGAEAAEPHSATLHGSEATVQSPCGKVISFRFIPSHARCWFISRGGAEDAEFFSIVVIDKYLSIRDADLSRVEAFSIFNYQFLIFNSLTWRYFPFSIINF